MLKITPRRQTRLLSNILNGLEPDIPLNQLSDDHYYLYQVITQAQNTQDAYQRLFRVKIDEPDLSDLIEAIVSSNAGEATKHQSLADIGPNLPDVIWLWPGWVPRGMLSVLAGEPGVGKTNLALDLAKRVIMGLAGPDKSELNLYTGNVIYVDAEKFLHVIYKRAIAWEMPLHPFYPFQSKEGEILDLGSQPYQDDLVDKCYDLQPDLVVVDSLSGISTKGENNVEDLRDVLNFLVELAESFNTAVVLTHHLRKPKQGQSTVTMHDLRGSGHLTAMARSILGCYVQSDDPNGPRRFAVLKTNLTKHPRPLTLSYVASRDPEISALSYDKVDLPAPPDNLSGECAEWLLEILSHGPLSYADICLMGEAHTPVFLQNTIQSARSHLDWQIIDTKGRQKKGNQWSLYDWTPEINKKPVISWSHGHEIHPPLPKTTPPPYLMAMRPCDRVFARFNDIPLKEIIL